MIPPKTTDILAHENGRFTGIYTIDSDECHSIKSIRIAVTISAFTFIPNTVTQIK